MTANQILMKFRAEKSNKLATQPYTNPSTPYQTLGATPNQLPTERQLKDGRNACLTEQ